ncbi:hypothetical protein GQ53DRAFT_838274 [Thozetella sp. PMI_491]|nr:hypothetical protein GQ53DRAFT_838274 [Thozetella sp. PMI_491]
MRSVFWHPWSLLFSNLALCAVSIAFTPPRIPLRLTVLLSIVTFTYVSFLHADLDQIADPYFFAGGMQAVVLFSNYFLLLDLMTPPHNCKNSFARLRWAWVVVLNPRGIGQPWQSRSLPAFSRSDRRYVPSRWAFCAQRLAMALLFFYFTDWYAPRVIHFLRLQSADLVAEKRDILFRIGSGDVTVREVLIRFWLPWNDGMLAYMNHTTVHCVISAFAVGVLGQAPAVWPPAYGDIRDAYFWQGFIYRAFVSNAFFLLKILSVVFHFEIPSPRNPRIKLVLRGTITFLVFVISAIFHGIESWVAGVCHVPAWRIFYFILTGFVIVVEDHVLFVIKNWFALEMAGRWRYLGYVWVWCFLAWAYPKFHLRDSTEC